MTAGKRFLLLPVAVLLGVLGLMAGPTEARAAGYPDQPKCVRVPLGDGQFRLYVNPGEVVKGDVAEVRSGRDQFTGRRDGVWVGTVGESLTNDWHFVFKSDARLFSDRRFSQWLHCEKVKVEPYEFGRFSG